MTTDNGGGGRTGRRTTRRGRRTTRTRRSRADEGDGRGGWTSRIYEEDGGGRKRTEEDGR
eukprot:9390319-Prorocentrum_lima.AAC.1